MHSQIQKQEDTYGTQAVRSIRFFTQRSTTESDTLEIYRALNQNYFHLMQKS